ncbi:MAG: hypothetical protein AAFQ82_15485, partial [Myxococcota bacterium]
PHEDTGTFLNPALSWDAAAAANPRLSLTGWEDRLDAEAWPELILSEDTPDTSWFAQLKRFERWRLDQESPQTDWFESPIETFEPAAMPLPDYRALRRWAKLRALEAAQGSSVLQAVAVEEIQHLARLMFSTDDTIAALIGTVILENALQVGLQVADEAELSRLKRVFRALGMLLSPAAPAEQFDLYRSMPVGHCFALNDVLPASTAVFLPILEHVVPEYAAAVDQAMQRAECSAKVLRRVWRNEDWAAHHMRGQSVFSTQDQELPLAARPVAEMDVFAVAESPWLSHRIGWVLLSVAATDPFAGYRAP